MADTHTPGSLPVFLPPSNEDLSALLARTNAKLLLPRHLNHDQQLLVYRERHRTRLEADPIYITLGKVTLPLEHIDRNTDVPDRAKTLHAVLAKSQTPQDWENVLRVVEGFHDAGLRIEDKRYEMVVRKLGEAGMQHLVLKAVQRSSDTGLRLRKEGVTLTVFKTFHDKALRSGWKATKSALSMAEQVTELMNDKEHLGRQAPLRGDLRASPFVMAVPLELAAIRAKANPEEKEKAAVLALRMMKAVHQDDFLKVGFRAAFRE